jgi:hypothetical protein
MSVFGTNSLSVYGVPSVELQVTRVVWGTDPDTPVKTYPGDTEAPLTVEVQNHSPNETIKGVKAVLMLQSSPFTDIYGSTNASATGEPVLVDVLDPTDEIFPQGFFTLTFTLDVNPNALPGTYSCDMIVDYAVNRTEGFILGTPQTVTVSLIISTASSLISCSVSPSRIEKGETIDVDGSLDPASNNVTLNLVYTKPDASTVSRIVLTKADGSYGDSYQPDIEGSWSVNASWAGSERYKGDWAPTMPSPLVIRGDNHWTIKYLESGNATTIPVVIYTPRSTIGSTYSASLDVSYRDDSGESYSETYNLGLIVKGWLDLIVYEKMLSPQPVNPGSEVTLTATILNKGNVAAMYANATILSSPILGLLPESNIYVGEVDENSPTPFTLIARVKPNSDDGVYPVAVNIVYRDDQQTDHHLNFTLQLIIEQISDQPTQPDQRDIVSLLFELRWTLLTTIGTSIAILSFYFYRRRSMKRNRTP